MHPNVYRLDSKNCSCQRKYLNILINILNSFTIKPTQALPMDMAKSFYGLDNCHGNYSVLGYASVSGLA